MFEVISVAPVEGGWTVEAPGVAGPLVFKGGGRAEAAAKRLAQAFAAAGRWAEVRITARDGAPVGRFVCAPREPVEAADLARGAGPSRPRGAGGRAGVNGAADRRG